MADTEWFRDFPGAITICDAQGIILEMNDLAEKSFEADGGRKLIGSNVLDCHPEPARTKLQAMLAGGQANVYTIEKRGKKKLIYQAPWYAAGRYAGIVELQLEIPFDLPHFVRAD
jgi:PAS domain-containing protein